MNGICEITKGTRKTAAYVVLVVGMATFIGMLFGAHFPNQ